jgi:excisionase family DNA binding protein
MTIDNQQAPFLTVLDVSKLLNIHTNTVRRWSDQKIIRSFRINNRGDRRFKREDINHFLDTYNANELLG